MSVEAHISGGVVLGGDGGGIGFCTGPFPVIYDELMLIDVANIGPYVSGSIISLDGLDSPEPGWNPYINYLDPYFQTSPAFTELWEELDPAAGTVIFTEGSPTAVRVCFLF